MKLILVQPPLTRIERYGTKLNSGEMNPPLGLAYLAASARASGHDVEILDAVAEDWDAERTAAELRKRGADVVGFTAVTASVMNANRVAGLIKDGPSRPLVLIGGPHFSAAPELTFDRCAHFDVGVIGEGEATLCDILSALAAHKREGIPGIPGTLVRMKAGHHFGPARARIRDLDSLPMPAWNLLPDLMTRYGVSAIHSTRAGKGMTLVTSRGCPGQCIFCSRGVFGHRYSAHSPQYVVEMVRLLRSRFNVGQIQFDDDEFLAHRGRTIEICRLFRDEFPDLRWCCFARVDDIDEEILAQLKSAGCWQIKFGIESGSQKILDRIGKRIKVEQIRRAVELTARAGILATGHFMIGHPGETVETVQETIRLACQLKLGEFFMTYVTPFPGTKLWEIAPQEGRYDPAWRDHSGWKPVFVPHSISAAKLVALRNKAYRKFYFRPRVIWSFLKRIRSPRQLLLTLRGFGFFLGLLAARMAGRKERARP